MFENNPAPRPAPPTPRNAAIERCCLARKRSYRDSRLKRLGTIESEVLADTAYRSVLPDLVGYENIRDFIACVTHGMQITAITAFQASKLLYGAQVALAALRIQPRPNECPNESQVPSPLPLPGYESESKT